MSNTKLQHLRSFLTERFTTVAVEIFGEIETIVEAYYEENKRLRSVLHMVLNPEIQLPRIDDGEYTGVTADVREQPPELTRMDVEKSEPSPKKAKEEQVQYDVSWGSEQQELREADHFIAPDCVKNDPEEAGPSMPCITDSFHIQVVELKTNNSSGTPTADEDEDGSATGLDAVSDCSQQSVSEESVLSESWDPQKHDTSSKSSTKKPKPPLQKTMLELPRMVSNHSFIPIPADCKAFLARLTEAFKDFPDDKKPLITKMGLMKEVEFVDCAFGKVPKGSPLSYQCPVPSDKQYETHENAPPRPPLPLPYQRLEPVLVSSTLGAKEQEHMKVMQLTWEAACSLEQSTRSCEKAVDELRNLRLTSRFREICKLKPGRSNAEHLIYKIQKGFPKCKSAQIEREMKGVALREYCKHLRVNWSPCGLVVHPNAPWLGAMPDGLVYDPNETPNFGLVHVKCIVFKSFIECRFLSCRDGVLQLKRTHPYYWHIQEEMMVTGTDWCDLLVCSRDDMLVQRIYRDTGCIKVMKRKLDDFFFQHYLPCLFETDVTA